MNLLRRLKVSSESNNSLLFKCQLKTVHKSYRRRRQRRRCQKIGAFRFTEWAVYGRYVDSLFDQTFWSTGGNSVPDIDSLSEGLEARIKITLERSLSLFSAFWSDFFTTCTVVHNLGPFFCVLAC